MMNFLVILLLSLGAQAHILPGDEDFARAFDAALLELHNEGEINRILYLYHIQTSGDLFELSSLSQEASYPLYNASEAANSTVLSLVLNRGTVKLSSRKINEGSRGDYSVNPPTGACPEIENLVVKRIGEHYGVNDLAIEIVFADTPSAVLDKLTNGEAEMTSTMLSLGGFSNGLRRSAIFRPSKTVIAEEVAMVVRKSTASTFEKLKSYVDINPFPIMGSVGSSAFQFMNMLWTSATVVPFPSDELALQALLTGQIIAYMGNPAAYMYNQTILDINILNTGLIMPRTAWFRKEILPQYKVENVTVLPYWQYGNNDLGMVYEAAINAMLEQDIFSKIYNRYKIDQSLSVVDCFTNAGAYVLPTTHVGTLKHIIGSGVIRIGCVKGHYYPLITVNETHALGALIELESKIVEWIARLLGLDTLVPTLVQFDSLTEALEALQSGAVDVTSSFFSHGGNFYNNSRSIIFRTSCCTNSYMTSIYVKQDSGISSVFDLRQYLKQHKTAKIGGVSENAQQLLLEIFRNYISKDQILILTDNGKALHSVQNGDIVALMPTMLYGHQANYSGLTHFKTDYIMAGGAFFRRDFSNACGDNMLDINLGEECDAGIGCTDFCKCETGYQPTRPLSKDCVKIWGVWAIVLVSVFSFAGFAFIIVLLIFAIVPFLRKHWMTTGANLMRSALISNRYPRAQNRHVPHAVSPLAPERYQSNI